MHSRIFQVNKKPIKEEDYISESDYWEHWFTNEIADYVVDSDDRNDDIKWLKESAKGYTVGHDINGDYIMITNRIEYFSNAFKRFKETLDSIKDCTIEHFIDGMHEIWSLKNVYEDRFGFYVDANGELMTFDSFIRYCNEGDIYYIGGTLDYHC